MKLKNLTLGALATLLAFGATSCGGDGSELTDTYTFGTYTLIADLDNNTAEAGAANFSFNFNYSTKKCTMSVRDLHAPANQLLNLDTDYMDFTALYADINSALHEAILVSGKNVGTVNGMEVGSLQAEMTTAVNPVPTDLTGFPVNKPQLKYSFINFRIGNKYTVRTFWNDIVFKGNTLTKYTDYASGELKSFSNDGISYRIIMDIPQNKATVIMYNAKFSDHPNHPTLVAVILRNLDLEFSVKGYTVSGTNIVPETPEGNGFTQNERFKFDSFSFTSTGDLTAGKASYQVAGAYEGLFEGTCMTTATM